MLPSWLSWEDIAVYCASMFVFLVWAVAFYRANKKFDDAGRELRSKWDKWNQGKEG